MDFLEDVYRVVLFGHRDFNGHKIIDEQLYPLIENIIHTKSFVEIYIGRNGEFDIYAATVIKRLQSSIGKINNEFICVLPYYVKDIEYYEKYYDSVIIPECIVNSHPKRAIRDRNKWMVEKSDLLVCYVERKEGGAYSALKYAEKLKKQTINLAKINFN